MASNVSGITRVRLAAAFAAVGLLAACEKSMDEVVAAHRAPVEAVFGRVRALAGPVAAAPRVAEDRIDTGGARIVLDAEEGEVANALYILGDDLASPEFATDDGFGAQHASRISGCGEALRGEFHGIAAGAESYLDECDNAEYLFVLRKHTEQYAAVNGEDTFEPGLFEGEVLLYRLADGAPLGGFQVHAASSDTVQVMVDANGVAIDPSERLNSDLEAEVFVAIQTGLRTHVPGAIPAE